MATTPPPGLQPGQPVRVNGRGHFGRCGTVAFVIDGDEQSPMEVWVDFGGGMVVPVERHLLEPVGPADETGVVDPVARGLDALRASWPSRRDAPR